MRFNTLYTSAVWPAARKCDATNIAFLSQHFLVVNFSKAIISFAKRKISVPSMQRSGALVKCAAHDSSKPKVFAFSPSRGFCVESKVNRDIRAKGIASLVMFYSLCKVT